MPQAAQRPPRRPWLANRRSWRKPLYPRPGSGRFGWEDPERDHNGEEANNVEDERDTLDDGDAAGGENVEGYGYCGDCEDHEGVVPGTRS